MLKRVTLEQLDKKLNILLTGQRKLEREEEQVESVERTVERQERKELSELAELSHVESALAKEVGPHPLTKVTIRDIAKGSIGAFVGIVAHFTFFYGIEVAAWLSFTRATLLYPVSFLIGGVFLYATGFRKIKDSRVMGFLPFRLVVLYLTSLVISFLVLFFFSPEFVHDPLTMYKQLSTVTLIAVIGACTADLIGKD